MVTEYIDCDRHNCESVYTSNRLSENQGPGEFRAPGFACELIGAAYDFFLDRRDRSAILPEPPTVFNATARCTRAYLVPDRRRRGGAFVAT
jgi:hypothetical protein